MSIGRDHPSRCAARSKKTGLKCGRMALVGSSYCQFHGGRRAQQVLLQKKGVYALPKFYSKYLGPKLKERLQELLEAPVDEQIALYEELAVTREMASQALKLAAPLWDEEMSKKLEPETRALLLSTVNSAMNSVKELVLAASRVEKDAADKVSVKVLNLVVMQIVSAVNDVCGTDNMDIAKAIAAAIDDRVRLPMNDRLASKIDVQIE